MPGLQVNFIQAALTQVAQHALQIHLLLLAGAQGDMSLLGLQGLLPTAAVKGAVNPYWTLGQKQVGVQRRFQPAVHHHQGGLARRGHGPHIHARVVFQHRANAREHRTGSGTPGMAVFACRRRGDPLADAIEQGGLPVHGGRHFEAYPGQASGHALEKTDVELARFFRPQPHLDLKPGSAQSRQALASHQRVGVFQRGHHPCHAGGHQRVAAGAGSALVGAGLQGDIRRGALDIDAALRGISQGHDFGVRLTRALRMPLAQDFTAGGGQHATHARVGRGQKQGLARQGQRLVHEGVVKRRERHEAELCGLMATNNRPC